MRLANFSDPRRVEFAPTVGFLVIFELKESNAAFNLDPLHSLPLPLSSTVSALLLANISSANMYLDYLRFARLPLSKRILPVKSVSVFTLYVRRARLISAYFLLSRNWVSLVPFSELHFCIFKSSKDGFFCL